MRWVRGTELPVRTSPRTLNRLPQADMRTDTAMIMEKCFQCRDNHGAGISLDQETSWVSCIYLIENSLFEASWKRKITSQ